MKTCFKCHAKLPLRKFYRHPMMGDGRLNKCIDCTKRDVQENYIRNRRHYQAYERERFRRPKRKAQMARYQRQRRERSPEKEKARRAVGNAIRDGRLTRNPCMVCGNPKSEAHHPDYSKPLSVMWLCRPHHRQEEGRSV